MEAPTDCLRASPAKASLKLADVLSAATRDAPSGLSPHHWKVINTLMACRTLKLGGHRYRCDHCGAEHFVPRSCGNRHCPNCQWTQAMDWLERQRRALLPTPYFHVVFTLPHKLNPLIQQNQRALYNLLFSSAAHTLQDFGRNNLGARLGVTSVLHTWSQTLIDHYHVHCIVTGGGPAIDGSGQWKSASSKYLFPVKALGKVFRGKFIQGLRRLHIRQKLEFHGNLASLAKEHAFEALMSKSCSKAWNVYAKRPFAGPAQVLEYLSRYTHRVAITHRRLIHCDREAEKVAFSYRTRDQQPQRKAMEISLREFLRRFALHILPERFVKIRHYGLLANRDRQKNVEEARAMILAQDGMASETIASCSPTEPQSAAFEKIPLEQTRICPQCNRMTMRYCGFRSPPIRGSPT